MSRETCPFMQLEVTTVPRRLLLKPRFKTTRMGPPLDHRSHHSPNVARSWPRAVTLQAMRLATREFDAMCARQVCVERFKFFSAHPLVIESLEQLTMNDVRKQYVDPKLRRGPAARIWIALPYHAAWFDAMRHAVRNFNRHRGLRLLWCQAFGTQEAEVPRVCVGWSSWLKPIGMILSGIGNGNMKRHLQEVEEL